MTEKKYHNKNDAHALLKQSMIDNNYTQADIAERTALSQRSVSAFIKNPNRTGHEVTSRIFKFLKIKGYPIDKPKSTYKPSKKSELQKIKLKKRRAVEEHARAKEEANYYDYL